MKFQQTLYFASSLLLGPYSSLFSYNDTKDKLIWSDCSNGEYSVSLGYRWFNRLLHQQATHIICWNWIWRLPIYENLRHFYWLRMHDILPTNAFGGSTHHTIDTTCHGCGAVIEDDIQTLCDSPNAMSIWSFIYDKITLEILY